MKTYLPYILICFLSFGAGYFFTYVESTDVKPPKSIQKEETLLEKHKRELSASPVTEAEVFGCEPKIIYKDRLKVVPLPIEPKIGCNVDWKKQKVMLYAPLGYKIKCWVNYETGEYKESIIPPRTANKSRPQSKLPLIRR